jgi:hypothetical protein
MLDKLFSEWDAVRDWIAGPGIGGGRLIGLGRGVGHALLGLFGHQLRDPSFDPKDLDRALAHTREALGLTDREVRALALLEELRAEQELWDWRGGAALRRDLEKDSRDTEQVTGEKKGRARQVAAEERYRRREMQRPVWPLRGLDIQRGFGRPRSAVQAEEDRRREFERHQAHKATYGVTRPKELWHEGVRRLRSEVGLAPAEIRDLADKLRWWWEAHPSAVDKALVAAAPPRRAVGIGTRSKGRKRREPS